MKKTFLLIVLFLIGISFFEAKAVDCPPGYYGPDTLTLHICDDCYWEIEWCCADLIGPSTVPQIFIKSIVLKSNNPNDPCTCVPTIQTTNGVRPVIPWNAIITGIIGSGNGCFSTLPPIPNCENTNALQIKITNGGCYRYIIDLNGKGYYLCEQQGENTSCFEYYEICYRLVNGVLVLEIKSLGPPSPSFNCENGCERICQ